LTPLVSTVEALPRGPPWIAIEHVLPEVEGLPALLALELRHDLTISQSHG
jgi:hypothetical protein